MSPEQTQGIEVDHRTDIWALGAVIYEMITGQQPFVGDYEQAVMYSIMNEDPEPLTALRTGVPMELERIVLKTLAKEPDERYQHVDEMLVDLKNLRKSQETGLSKTAKRSGTLSGQKTGSVQPKPSIAVPFTNMSADPEQEYFCDGMAEEIINALTRVKNLHVVARTSAFSFKGQNINIKKIGKELVVKHVLEGSVRKAGNQLRISAQLIKVDDGYHMWSDRYDRVLEDVFAIQDEISLAIVEKLKAELLGEQPPALVQRATENMEAYNHYLKGLHYRSKWSPETAPQAVECFKKAIELDFGICQSVCIARRNIYRYDQHWCPESAFAQ